jgi:hypothetical protein
MDFMIFGRSGESPEPPLNLEKSLTCISHFTIKMKIITQQKWKTESNFEKWFSLQKSFHTSSKSIIILNKVIKILPNYQLLKINWKSFRNIWKFSFVNYLNSIHLESKLWHFNSIHISSNLKFPDLCKLSNGTNYNCASENFHHYLLKIMVFQ